MKVDEHLYLDSPDQNIFGQSVQKMFQNSALLLKLQAKQKYYKINNPMLNYIVKNH